MKMQLLGSAIYRVPQFGYQSRIRENWQDLLASIAISSPGFYELVKGLDPSDPKFDNDPLYHTVWKYFNRARFRATPYGTFASVGLSTIKSSTTPLILADSVVHQHLPDWSECADIKHDFQQLVSRDAKVFANSSYYIIGNSIRYIGSEKEGYEMFEVDNDNMTIAILEACNLPIRISDLAQSSLPAVNGTKKLMEQIERMLDDQLLVTELSPNSIGEDFFHRIGKAEHATKNYHLSVRPAINGSLDSKPFRHLPELVDRLQQLLPSYYSLDLAQFKSDFSKKYGEAEIPIMQALDPECGVGYGSLDEDGLRSPLMDTLNSNKKTDQDDDHQTLRLLLPFLAGKQRQIIQLEDITVPSPSHAKEPLPNTLPVLATVVDDLIQIEHIGGATANSLIGRFTHATEDIHVLSKNLATIEMSANPNVYFFDIDYLVGSGAAIDNVNRRKQIYPMQVSLLNYDTSNMPLSLQDILVSVRGDQIILRSRSLDSRLVPRFASAYNYMLSSLPVFRMLCDLQHQGIHKNLYLRLKDRLPSLDYYPRIQFRNIILSPHTWKVAYKTLSAAESENGSESLRALVKDRNIAKMVRVGSSDQTLCIDTDNEDDLRQLYQVLKKNGTLHLEEVLLPATAAVIDSSGAPYLPQVLLSLYHQENIYTGLSGSKRLAGNDRRDRKVIAPGGHWIYFKIFCYPARANTILSETIAGILPKYCQHIEKWFFIRYTEGGHHVRLRIEAKDVYSAIEITAALNQIFQELLNTGLIKDLSLHTYEPEYARYGDEYMDAMEAHFCQDSYYVLKALEYDSTDMDRYSLCISLLQQIGNAGIFGSDEWDRLIRSNGDQFTSEHQLKPDAFKALNQTFKKLEFGFYENASEQLQKVAVTFVTSFVEMLGRYPKEARAIIFGDMWHMHINKLFSTVQRSHELAIYYFMHKFLSQQKHMRCPIT